MRFGADILRDKALLALEEAAGDASVKQVRRTLALRFALAYLANGAADRWPFDWFWKSLDGLEPIGRHANVQAALRGIYLQLGLKRQD